MKMDVLGTREQVSASNAQPLSQIGFGTYQMDPSVPAHKEAVRQSILNGINLIDTCAVYSNGKTEQCIGEVVAELIEEGEITREELHIVSKVGAIQYELYTRVVDADTRPEELLVVQEGMYAICIHPEFIEQQLTEDLERLNLSYIDTYLLHDPESFLMWSKLQGVDHEVAQAEFYDRIERAFVHLEKEVANGRIKRYGISSTTLHFPADAYEFTSLERLLKIAEAISPQHSFSMIQFPMNIIETGGMTEKNQPLDQNVIQFAKSKGVTVTVNRPVEAYYENLWIRLTDVEAVTAEQPATIIRLIDEVNELEETMIETLPFSLVQRKKLSLGIYLQQYWRDCTSGLHFAQTWAGRYGPLIEEIVENIDELATPEAKVWSERYRQQVAGIYAAIECYYRSSDHKRNTAIKHVLASVNPDWAATDTLTQSAIRALRSTEGIDCVLVGMHEAYRQEVLDELQQPLPASVSDALWSELHDAMKRDVFQ